jgi:AmiR/NasT family two-component response regulator
MGTRRVIDQAIGLIMAQNRCSADDAFDILRRASQNRNLKINRLASDMIRL